LKQRTGAKRHRRPGHCIPEGETKGKRSGNAGEKGGNFWGGKQEMWGLKRSGETRKNHRVYQTKGVSLNFGKQKGNTLKCREERVIWKRARDGKAVREKGLFMLLAKCLLGKRASRKNSRIGKGTPKM